MDRLDEIRARCEAAALGPWWWSLSDLRVVVWGGAQDGNAATGKQIVVDGDDDLTCCPENAEFITNAREDIPYLLEEVKQARAERDHIKLSNDGLCVSHDNLYARLREATARAEKAEAERNTYREALEELHINVNLLKGE